MKIFTQNPGEREGAVVHPVPHTLQEQCLELCSVLLLAWKYLHDWIKFPDFRIKTSLLFSYLPYFSWRRHLGRYLPGQSLKLLCSCISCKSLFYWYLPLVDYSVCITTDWPFKKFSVQAHPTHDPQIARIPSQPILQQTSALSYQTKISSLPHLTHIFSFWQRIDLWATIFKGELLEEQN